MIKKIKFLYKTLGLVILKKQIIIAFNKLKRNQNQNQIPFKSFGLKNKHVFFGYYDLNPISNDNSKILAIAVPLKRRTSSVALIGYFNTENEKEFCEIGTTQTWCWQQGARLSWSLNNDKIIIYNNLYNKQYGCVFQDIKTKKVVKQLSFPIYDLSNNEKYGLSLNFSRLQRLRAGYGYDNIEEDNTKNEKASSEDGVFLINVDNNTSKLIISLDKLSNIEPQDSMKGAEHYINHLSWNKSGIRFLFFHLWTKGDFRSSRLFTADKNGGNICLLENEEAVSHYDWKNDDYICLTTHSKKFGSRYSIYKDKSKERVILNPKILDKDGHPTYHPSDEDLFLSDTYPDKYGERKLFTYKVKKEKINIIGAFNSPIKYRSDYRCDLHPRWNKDGTKIAFDSTHTNKRTINIIDFEDIIHT